MALDAATLALTAAELGRIVTDAKIAKIFEPTRDELVITLRTRTDTYSLLLSARSGSARVCLTGETFENPETPPSFCMLMRKHLTGGRLIAVRMEPGDRIVYFDFLCTNEMGDLVTNTLCAELMGRYSNLVLVQNGKIIDALKRVERPPARRTCRWPPPSAGRWRVWGRWSAGKRPGGPSDPKNRPPASWTRPASAACWTPSKR